MFKRITPSKTPIDPKKNRPYQMSPREKPVNSTNYLYMEESSPRTKFIQQNYSNIDH